MTHTEFVLSATDAASLHFYVWTPDAELRGVVCLVHGLGEHCGRYAHVAAALNDAGYAVLGFDQRGHGKTPGPRGVTPPFEHLMDDVSLLLNVAAERYPEKPRFLYGHSMGGNWVVNHALRRKPQIAGIIATSPGLRTAFAPPPVKVALGKLMYRIAPDLVMPNGLELDAISRDAAVVAAYIADPLVHNKMSARLGLDILQQGGWAMNHAAEFPALSLLLVHGECDRITSAAATQEFASKIRGDVTLKLWPQRYHETHNDPDKDEVLQYMIGWLDQRTPAS